ncbi:MAG TPA: hypothetical protein VNC78_01355 [Actinomycetota bacterium]|nr:hypothetical protein [Actinomycetota bacterium]
MQTRRKRGHAVKSSSIAAVVLIVIGAIGAPSLAGPSSKKPGRGKAASKPTVIPWGLNDCDGVIGFSPVSAESIQPFLPEGFTATVPDDFRAALPPDPRVDAVLGLEAFRCADGVGLSGIVPDLEYGSLFTFVEPPAALADSRYPWSFVKWDTLVPDAPRQTALAKRGLPARLGEAVFFGWAVTPVGIPFDVILRLEEAGNYGMTGIAAAATAFDAKFIEYMPGDRGLAQWRTVGRSPGGFAGGGWLSVPSGSYAAEILGGTEAQAYFLASEGIDFTEASITLP